MNINIDTDDVQYLRRNNVYTVIIKDILSRGLILPMMLTSRQLWRHTNCYCSYGLEVPDGIVTPPDVEVN